MKSIKKIIGLCCALAILASLLVSPASASYNSVAYPAEGDYYICPEANTNYALDLSGGGTATYTFFQLYQRNGTGAQIFTLKRVSGEWYKLIHKESGKVVNVQNGISKNDARLWLYPDDGTASCYFRFVKIGGTDSYAIQNLLSPYRVLDLDNAQTFNGSIIHLWDQHVNLSARWKLIPVSSSSLVDSNLSKVSYIKQGSETCKASSVAMAINLLTGKNTETTSSRGGSNCTWIDGKTYMGSDGRTYVATYKTDDYVGSATEQTNAINAALSAGLPIVVAVHSTKSTGTKHHWVVVIGKSGNDYLIVDPASGSSGSMSANIKMMSSCSYSFGLTNYSKPHYGYVSFSRK